MVNAYYPNMTHHYVPLLRHLIADAHKGYAMYSLKHIPTSRLYIGSTASLCDKLRWWHTAIVSPNAKVHLSPAMTNTLAEFGRHEADWAWMIMSSIPPEGWSRHHKHELRPEWPYVKRLHETTPDLLLNNTAPMRISAIVPARVTSRMGMSPRSYLAIRLGVKHGVRYASLPPHSWRISTRALPPLGFQAISFPGYLLRQLREAKVYNPSAETIAASYHHWLGHVPVTERAALGEVPYTIDHALNVPVPRGYALV